MTSVSAHPNVSKVRPSIENGVLGDRFKAGSRPTDDYSCKYCVCIKPGFAGLAVYIRARAPSNSFSSDPDSSRSHPRLFGPTPWDSLLQLALYSTSYFLGTRTADEDTITRVEPGKFSTSQTGSVSCLLLGCLFIRQATPAQDSFDSRVLYGVLCVLLCTPQEANHCLFDRVAFQGNPPQA